MVPSWLKANMSALYNMFSELAGVDKGVRGPRGLSAFGAFDDAAGSDPIVRRGDTVLVTFYANPAYQLDPFAHPDVDLQSRLQTAGFQVLKIDASALSGLLAILGGGWGDVLVTVKPLTSDYSNAYDVASTVAGAASASGFNVDFTKTRGAIVQRATTGQMLPTYEQTQYDPNRTIDKDYVKEVADQFGVSKVTLGLGAAGLVALLLFLSVKK